MEPIFIVHTDVCIFVRFHRRFKLAYCDFTKKYLLKTPQGEKYISTELGEYIKAKYV